MNKRDAVVVADRAVNARQRHAAESDRGHLDIGGAELTFLDRFGHFNTFSAYKSRAVFFRI